MHKTKCIVFLITVTLCVLNCNNPKAEVHHYEDQIGDTPFDPERDNASFAFCDSTNVLHKRALIQYSGGLRAMYSDLQNKYVFQENYSSFSGSFIVRFAVNCTGELGRFRTQIVDSNSVQTKAPKGLESHIISVMKEMKGWNHAYYKGNDSDCYTFIVITFKQGKISIT